MTATVTGVGAAVKRKEDPRLVTGTATYTDDIKLPGMLHLQVVRSPHAHARLIRIDTSRACTAPGVVAAFTASDLERFFKAPLPCAWAAYPHLKNPAHWPLAVGKVRYVGEPVAIVLAESREMARDAAELIGVDYEPLPAVVDLEGALKAGATRVHDDLADNVSFTFDHATDGVAAAFAEAERSGVVVRQRLVQQRLVPHALEPRAVVADWRRHAGELTMYSSTQIPHLLKIFTAVVLGLPEHQVRVVAPEVGGGFGSKLQVYSEEMLACAAAMAVGRPVKWTMERHEEFLSTHHGREGILDCEFAATRDGVITGIRVNWLSDMGAYNMLNGPYVPILGFLVLPGPYRNKQFECHIKGVFTNKVGTDAYRGAGRPEATHVLERMTDLVARACGLDPVEVRRRNLITPAEFPFTNASGITYDVGDYQKALNEALERVDYAALRAEQVERLASGSKKLLGVGISTYIEACGLAPSKATAGSFYGAHLYESAEVRVHHTGTVTVFTGSSSHGQGHETAYAQIVSERLGVPISDVEIVHGDTARGPLGLGTYGSRSLVVGGMALYKALDRVREKARIIAAHKLECHCDDVEVAPGKLHIKGAPDRAVSFSDVAMAANLGSHAGVPEGMEPGLEATAFFSPENFSYPAGTHICAVEVDTETGKVDIRRFVAVDDCGVVLNPLLAEGQVHGGLAQGVAQALFEEFRYDSSGQPQGASLMDYAFPTIMDLPSFETSFSVTPSPTNPMGVKGIGEAGTIGSTVAVVNAVVDALSSLGVRDIDMPLTPQRVWQAIQRAKEAC